MGRNAARGVDPEQTGAFLDHAIHDGLYPLFHLDAGSMGVFNPLVQYDWETGMDTSVSGRVSLLGRVSGTRVP